MNRRDLIADCVTPGIPVDVLKASWCDRCKNPECSRSSVGLSIFESRIKDWEKKLFIERPVLAPDDPLYATIAAKKFITIDPGRVPELSSSWVDPRDLSEPAPVLIETEAAPRVPPPPPGEGDGSPPVEASPRATPSTATSEHPKGSPRRSVLVGANAPDQSGKMLPGAPQGPTTKVDPWAPPEPLKPGEIVVLPGARIKMGGGSGV